MAALDAVAEQDAALELVREGRLRYAADDPDCPDLLRLAALAEELGEVARCLHDNDRDNIRVELAQLAGIALAWSTITTQEGLRQPTEAAEPPKGSVT